MPELRACTVSYCDIEGVTHSVDVTAESLYEAAILGMQAMKVPNWVNMSNLSIEIQAKVPATRHTIWNSVLTAWLARNGKTVKEQALKVRLRELIRG